MKDKRIIFIFCIGLGWLFISFVIYVVNRIMDGEPLSNELAIFWGGTILVCACYLIMRIIWYNRSITQLNKQIYNIENDILRSKECIRQQIVGQTQPSDYTYNLLDVYREMLNNKYPHFIEELRKEVPSITEGEETLSMLIKLNLRNTEIVEILGIDTNSIYTFRSRLKRKLPLKEEEQMDHWIRELGERL